MSLKLKLELGDGLFGVDSKTVLSQDSRETCCLMTMDNGQWTLDIGRSYDHAYTMWIIFQRATATATSTATATAPDEKTQ